MYKVLGQNKLQSTLRVYTFKMEKIYVRKLPFFEKIFLVSMYPSVFSKKL